MHQLINSFSIPWYIWLGLGVFLTLLITKPAVRHESDAFLARLLGMRARKNQDEDDEE